MNHTTTYPPQTPRYYMGGYRYFFNGQEADNELLLIIFGCHHSSKQEFNLAGIGTITPEQENM